jgi:hypothetical protein
MKCGKNDKLTLVLSEVNPKELTLVLSEVNPKEPYDMDELDKSRWKKVERLSDKVSYVLEAVIRWQEEKETLEAIGMEGKGRTVLPELEGIMYEFGEHMDVREAKELFKVIGNTRLDRATTAKEKW